jgi:glycopeptide antibiotics resistance protein
LGERTRRALYLACYTLGGGMLGLSAHMGLYAALDARGMLTLAASTLLPLLLATVLRCKSVAARAKRRRSVRLLLVLCLSFYALMVTNALFIGRAPGAASLSANYIPLRTLWGYARALFGAGIDSAVIARYLLGNVALCMPLGLLLPCLFRGLGKDGPFLWTVVAIASGVAGLRHALSFGGFDVDGVLLNLCGAYAVFLLFSTKPARKLMHRLYMVDKA